MQWYESSLSFRTYSRFIAYQGINRLNLRQKNWNFGRVEYFEWDSLEGSDCRTSEGSKPRCQVEVDIITVDFSSKGSETHDRR